MSARLDAKRVTALVVAVWAIAKGKPQSIGDLAGSVFGWPTERVFLAIDAAMQAGTIAKNSEGVVAPAKVPR